MRVIAILKSRIFIHSGPLQHHALIADVAASR